MLGRLAKGVGGLAKGVAGVALGEARSALTAVPNDEAEVEGLLQRISGSLLPEYRRQAMSQLKDLLVDNPKAQLAFGSMGIPVLLAVLRDDRDDVALLQSALEALGQGFPPGLTPAEATAAALNADLLAREREHVGLLLGLLEDEPVGVPDFYVRYHAVQLLTSLLSHCAGKLQEAILATPMSVVRLTELLGERSEVIRNEALLLLAALTRTDPRVGGAGGASGAGGGSEVQKIAAFEGAFDRVAELLREEGGLGGGMVVQDTAPASPSEIPGPDDSARLVWAVAQMGRLAREMDELRARNRALAEDLFRLSQSGLGSAPPPPPHPGASASVYGMGPHPQPHHGGPHSASQAFGPYSQPHPQPLVGGPGGTSMAVVQPPQPAVVVNSAADVEARVALELRAGRAEQEVAALRQQLEVMAARLSQAEADAAAAREAAAAAHVAASKAEADLADLSGAYNNLEAHAFATEAQLRSAQGALAAAQAAAAAAEARSQAAAAGATGPAHGAGGLSEADIQRRIEEAVAEARAEGKAEAEEGMTDLFVCLGQEERKVEVLRQALEGLGLDAESLLATIQEEEGG
ncbi:hypothetical protein VOLCADRAFT_100860 [Volvox carteri f. nagariensis]|uniref:Uncharacterized protein n=1 Tax=Volvox carteri f. nagariensis TaxID=3068 RepID=D8UL72_VOLCA|nr:uncharacterized protein VOLCADRAFT_100860 [Volvox carteri f. nagariensis]EFJ39529.1 hypothetical protein VOLCADRAFT_100860 [Volvox carteri f. nagariensis]|eukprot:XP_002959408.1 hypothetical protein VOLCADRAFT_100860 [Volvox carteri f. nagariensis]